MRTITLKKRSEKLRITLKNLCVHVEKIISEKTGPQKTKHAALAKTSSVGPIGKFDLKAMSYVC